MKTNTTIPVSGTEGEMQTTETSSSDMSMSEVPSWMREAQASRRMNAPMTPNQLTSIAAMIAYISHQSGQSEFRIERSLADRFNVANAKCLPSNAFDNAIRYLADILSA